MDKKEKRMGDCYEELGITVLEMLDLLNETTGRILAFKKHYVDFEPMKPETAQALKREAEDLHIFIKSNCGKLSNMLTFADMMHEQARTLCTLATRK